jgi:S1-C subfamily serine protease
MPRPIILLLAMAWPGVSCQFKDTDQNRARAAALINPRREASLVYWKDKTLHGRPALDFPPLITGIVLPPNVRTTYKVTLLPGGVYQYDMVFSTTGTFFAGAAVPLTRDGYFLTAAHCVDQGPGCTLVAPAINETFRTVPARVVWRGGNHKDDPDLALIHAPLTPHTILAMAPLDTLYRNQPVLTSGVGSNGFPKLKQGAGGGHLAEIGRIQEKPDGEKWRQFSHTAPLAPGDSGGPVIGEDGKLLGINTAIAGAAFFPFGFNKIWRYRGSGEAADSAWIQSLIDQDRKDRKVRKKRPR